MADESEMARTSLKQALAFHAEERQRERREVELKDMAAEQVEGILRSLIADPTARHLQETILAGLIEGRPLPMPQAIRTGAASDAPLHGVVGRLEAVATSLEALAAEPRRSPAARAVPIPASRPPAVRDEAPLVAPAASSPGPIAETLFQAPAPDAAPASPLVEAKPPAGKPTATVARTSVGRPPRAGIGKPRGSSDSSVLMDLVILMAKRSGRPVTVAEVTAEARAEDFNFKDKSNKYVDELLSKYAIKFPVEGGESHWWPSAEPLPDHVPYRRAVLPSYDNGDGLREIGNWNNSKTPDMAIAFEPRGRRGASASAGQGEGDDAED